MLPKNNRLTKNKEFEQVFQAGKSYFGKLIGVKTIKNGMEISRFGFLVANKISKKATVRNLIKRRLRAIIQLNLNNIAKGYDCVILTQPAIKDQEYSTIENELVMALKKINLL